MLSLGVLSLLKLASILPVMGRDPPGFMPRGAQLRGPAQTPQGRGTAAAGDSGWDTHPTPSCDHADSAYSFGSLPQGYRGDTLHGDSQISDQFCMFI